jgi:tryptophanyl-tRNA synthetase
MGLLERAHAWKDALSKGTKDPTVALFTYPILMAADILLYEPDLVPVGRDQKQHIEICRDIAVKFNNMFGSVFKLPEEFIIEETAVVVGTDGERKMSKSLGNVINFFADEATLRKQVMGIKTDSKGVDEPKNPNDSAIVSLYKHFASPDELIDLESRFLSGIGYGDSKKILFEAIMDYFRPYREKRIELKNNMDYIYQVLENGNKKAISQAESVISRVKEKTGLC